MRWQLQIELLIRVFRGLIESKLEDQQLQLNLRHGEAAQSSHDQLWTHKIVPRAVCKDQVEFPHESEVLDWNFWLLGFV